jgi:ligand-binding sensor domain-containing protein
MRYLLLAILCHLFPSSCLAAERYEFECEQFTSTNGALFHTSGFQSNSDNLVTGLLVDSIGRLWVGTQTGLAVYDGTNWSSRTFPLSDMNPSSRLAFGILQITNCGQDRIVEGTSGEIWFAGRAGIWRFHDNEYRKIEGAPQDQVLGMAVAPTGILWIVTKYAAYKYDGKTWTSALCPYFTNSIHRELPGLFGLAIETNGNVWIGGTVYSETKAPSAHVGEVWLVDQARRDRSQGPPMAPLFLYDGVRWMAFGAEVGLKVKSARPVSPAGERIMAWTSNGYYVRVKERWSKLAPQPDAFAGQHWSLSERKDKFLRGYAKLIFRLGDQRIDVHPVNRETGEVLNLQSEQLASLRIAEDKRKSCLWLGTWHGLYRIWHVKAAQ